MEAHTGPARPQPSRLCGSSWEQRPGLLSVSESRSQGGTGRCRDFSERVQEPLCELGTPTHAVAWGLFPVSSLCLGCPLGLLGLVPGCVSRWTSLLNTRVSVVQTKPG